MRWPIPVIGAATVAALIAGTVVLWPEPTVHLHAEFGSAEGIVPGTHVTVLGVPVGSVDSVDQALSSIEVTMSVSADTEIAADTNAWVVSPSVISDRYIELEPATEGHLLEPDATIPIERTHSPMSWDAVLTAVDDLVGALAPAPDSDQSSAGLLVGSLAHSLDGNGDAVARAIASLSSATTVVGNGSDDIAEIVDGLRTLLDAVTDNRTQLDSLARSVESTATVLDRQRGTVTAALTGLDDVMSSLGSIVSEHGADMTDTVAQLRGLASDLNARGPQLAELLEVAPVALGNVSDAVGPDNRLRVRLDFSSTLSQYPSARDLCNRTPLPLCSAPGLYNPITVPGESPLLAEIWGKAIG
ncbi:MCE-family protein Mce1D [Rhodococcus sp. B7740]|uniref:MCE family protein n=1 Tax=Rhodococcus sp. B7740 TaxID=1564114 RepID=UPI0005DA64E3|nr:MCE family protein [Rhodococcus sp. B7740]AJW40233.1 MCE-family protein Mce1D [Rhodococcus sp. B7740]